MNGALSASVAVVNSGEILKLAEWAQLAHLCQATLERAGVVDDAIEAAAAVARVAAVVEQGQALHPIAATIAEGSPNPSQLRATLAMATHAARRDAVPTHLDTMLAGVESQLLRRATLATMPNQSLNDWPTHISRLGEAEQLHPRVAMAITHLHAELLRQADATAKRLIESPEGVFDLERFRSHAQTAASAWRAARAELSHQPEVGLSPAHAGVATAVSLAAKDLRDAMRNQATTPPQEQFQRMAESGMAGNLLVATHIAPLVADELTREFLLLTAERLDRLTRSGIDNSAGWLTEQMATAQTSSRPSPTTQGRTPSPVIGQVEEGRLAPQEISLEAQAPDFHLSSSAARELARRRDAGIAAESAQAGTSEAVHLLEGASTAELNALVREGRRARGELMAGALPLVRWRLIGRTSDWQECYSAACEAVAKGAHTWDPARSNWSTFAVLCTDWAIARHLRNESNAPIPVVLAADTRSAGPWSVSPSKLAALGPGPDEEAVASIAELQARDLLSQLPSQTREILRRAMGFEDGSPRSASQLGRDIGLPASTVSRNLNAGLRLLRSQMGVDLND